MNPFAGLIARFGLGRLVAILGGAAGVAAAFFAIFMHMGNEPKALLYSNLDLKEAGTITRRWTRPTSSTKPAATAPPSWWRVTMSHPPG